MDAIELASYAMAGGGLVLVAVGLRVMFKMKVAHRVANAMLVKLATAGNADRAEKLCYAARGTYLDAIAAAIAAGRATKSTDLVTLAAASRPAFDAAGTKLAMHWRTHANTGLVGAMLLAGGFALDFDAAHLRIPLVAGAAIGLLAAAWIAVHRGEIDAALASARSDVLPVVEQALAGMAPTTDAAKRAGLPELRDPDRVEKERRAALVEQATRGPASEAAPAKPAAAPSPSAPVRPSRPSVVDALAAPVANRATSSLRSGTCPLCKHTEIRTMSRTSGFLTYICGSCGYTQEFAEL